MTKEKQKNRTNVHANKTTDSFALMTEQKQLRMIIWLKLVRKKTL